MTSRTDVVPSTAGSFESTWAISKTIEGWMTWEQGLALFRAAQAAPPGSRIVEIGSHHGRSTVLLAKAAPAGVSVLAVDPYEDVRWGGGASAYNIFRANLDRAAAWTSRRPVRS